MAPKKDDKKSKKEGQATLKEIDLNHYVRKIEGLPEVNPKAYIPISRSQGKIALIDQVFPIWSDADNRSEPWSEPHPPTTTKYPACLNIEKCIPATQFFNLEPSEPVDTKATKKKDPPKKPLPKGAKDEPAEMTEVLINEAGVTLPVVYRGNDFAMIPEELRPFFPSPPSDNPNIPDDNDPYLCEAFRLVCRLFPLTGGQAKSSFLWQGIYPQTAGGKPVYNPSGRYTVRLFLSGHWRRVPIDDSIPVNAIGQPVMVMSSDSLELWPLLLAKALYTVYSALHLRFLDEPEFSSPEFSAAPSSADSENKASAGKGKGLKLGVPSLFLTQGLSTPDRISCFMLFSLHTLTGWMPHTSVDFTRLLSEDGVSKVGRLLDSMVVAGTPVIDKGVRLENEDDTSYHLLTGATNGKEEQQQAEEEGEAVQDVTGEEMAFKTKRRFKEEYAAREAQRAQIVSAILSREHKLNATHNILTPNTDSTQQEQQARSELFLLLRYDCSVDRYRVWPLLALSHDDVRQENKSTFTSVFTSISTAASTSTATSNKDRLLSQTRVLLQWRKLPPVSTLPSSPDAILQGKGKYKVGTLQDPFPLASPVIRQWLSLQQLLSPDEKKKRGEGDTFTNHGDTFTNHGDTHPVLLMGLFTGSNTTHKASFLRPWQPLEAVLAAQQVTPKEPVADPKDAKKKPAESNKGDKNKKEATAEGSDLSNVIYADPGPPAPTLLSVDMTEIAPATLQEMKRLIEEQLNQLQQLEQEENEFDEFLEEEAEENNEENLEEKEAILDQEHRLHELSSDSKPPAKEEKEAESNQVEKRTVPLQKPRSTSARESKVQFTNMDAPRVPCLNITVTIQVDMLKLEPQLTEEEEEAAVNTAVNAAADAAKRGINPTGSFIAASSEQVQPLLSTRQSWDATTYHKHGLQTRKVILPSDTVLVIQEVRLDDQIPLMGVLELKDFAHLPLISKSFSFPLPKGYKLNGDGSAPKIDFWLRLFSKCSVQIQLMSNAPLKVDLAERVWGADRGVFVAEGESMATVQGVETLLFRLPLLIPPTVASESESETEQQQGNNEKAIVFLHLPERPVERLTQLMLGQLQEHNRFTSIEEVGQGGGVQGVLVPLTADNGSGDFQSLLAVTFPPEPDPYTTLATTHKDQLPLQVPPFKWKLIVLSNTPLLPLPATRASSIAEVPSGQRLTGSYIANNQRKLFRDVLTLDKVAATGVPMAFRLTVHPLIDPPVEEQVHNVEPFQANSDNDEEPAVGDDEDLDISVIVSLYRKHDLRLVAEYRGGRTLHCYYQDLAAFLPDPNDYSAATAGIALPGKKDESKAKKGKEEAKAEGIDLIIDCCLDPTAMTIPKRFTSRYPHAFDSHSNEEVIKAQSQLLRDLPPTKPLLAWTLDILAGKLLNVAHDTTLLLQQQAVKKSWLAEDAARIDKAQAAVGYVLERDHLIHHNANQHSQAELMSHSPSHESKEQLDPAAGLSSSPSQHEVVLSASLLEQLVTALDADPEEIKARFTTLLSLPHIDEAVEIVPDHPHAAPGESLINPYQADRPIGSEAWSAAVQSRREQEAQAHEQHYQQLINRAAELSVSYREQCAARLTVLNERVHSQRSAALHAMLAPRAKLRLEAEVKNSALSFLLKRAKDAKTAAATSEAAAEAERLKQEAKNAKNKKK